LLLLAPCILPLPELIAADWPQWRGPQRNGQSTETGLLAEWPAGGPKLAWHMHDAGSGYSTPAITGDRLFLMGNDGLDNEFVAARSTTDGQKLWQTRVGKVGNPDQKPSFPAARSTPTVVGDSLYALGSDGDLVCLETATGKTLWHKNLRTDFGGKPGTWAYAESPLIDGHSLVCTPGGPDATLVALDRITGAPLWKTAIPGGDDAAYSSPIIVDAGGVKQYVQMLNKGLVGVAAKTGQYLWRYDKTVSKYGANIPTPLALNDLVFSAGAGTGAGAIRLKATGNTVVPEPVYFSPKLPTAIGGAVLVGDHLYGTASQSLLCVEFATGTVKWEERALGPASLCLADGRLYLHGENGEAALVEPSPTGYLEKGRFTPPNPPKRREAMERAWTYPVVANQHLYLRDHTELWCYDIAHR
jgi:hypothetical protein